MLNGTWSALTVLKKHRDMTQKQIEENKLIAEFMGYDYDDKRYFIGQHLVCNYIDLDCLETSEEGWNSWMYPKDMRFHASWDWLMLIVQRIEQNPEYNVEINHNSCTITHFKTVYGKTKIEATYNAVIEFIRWHNQKSNYC